MKTIKALIRLWKISRCTHRNMTNLLEIHRIEICVCTGCGRVLYIMDEQDKKNNPWLEHRAY